MVNKMVEVLPEEDAEDEEEEEEKEEVVVPVIRVKYTRSIKPDEERCQQMMKKGTRCTLARYGGSTFCSRHAIQKGTE